MRIAVCIFFISESRNDLKEKRPGGWVVFLKREVYVHEMFVGTWGKLFLFILLFPVL